MASKKDFLQHPLGNQPDKVSTSKNFLRTLLYGLTTILMTVFVVGLLPAPSMGYIDNDYPHNNLSNLSCNTGTCHDMGRDARLPVYPAIENVDSPYSEACLWCHDGIPKPTDDPDNPGNTILLNNPTGPVVVSHSSTTTSGKYGTWAMECLDCHDGMYQQQYFAWGSASYLYSGTSTVTGDNFVDGVYVNSTLTKTGANWTPGSLVGLLLFPDVVNDWSMYYITANTSDTITVKGPMGIAGRSTSFGVTYRMMISQQVPYEPDRWYLPWYGIDGNVRFFRPTGQNSFADGDTTYDGICEVCHTMTNHHRKDGSAPAQAHFNGERCTACHPHSAGFKAMALDHLQAGVVVPATQCTVCHTTTGDPVVDIHGNQCGLCHVSSSGGGPLVPPLETTVPSGGDCTACHGTDVAQIHPNANHTATPASDLVVLFEANQHIGAGSGGPFTAFVDCGICHTNSLPAIHGNDCATCHPSAYDALGGAWNGGCQQGGCHVTYHQDATAAHGQFDNENDCLNCHVYETWNVTQGMCLNCHADASQTGDVIPPETFCDVKSQYFGPAMISFSVVDDGMVGVGRTFYRLDAGPTTASGKYLSVTALGAHSLEFWSVDQAGNVEPPHTVSFTVAEPSSQVIAPASLTVPATGTSTSLSVSWGASPAEGVTYVLERSLNGGTFSLVYSGTATTTTVSGMNSGTYVFRVKATKSGYPDSDYVTSGPCVVILTASAPASITAPGTDTDGAFSVSWTASSTLGVTYNLELSDNGGAFAPVYSGTALTYAFTGLSSGNYVFRVKATKNSHVDSAYRTSGTCAVTVVTIDAPASLTVPATDPDGTFTVSWPASLLTGVTYKLERADNGGAFVQVYSGASLSTVVAGLPSGTYQFRVKAVKSGYLDSSYTTSGTCAVTVITVEPSASISVPATSTSISLVVSWGVSPTSGVTYVLERSLNGGAFGKVYSGTATTTTVSGMGNATYMFRVKATKSGYVDSAYVTSGTCVGTLTAVAPASITVPATDADGKFTVNWTASETSWVTYKLEFSADGGTTFSQIYSGTSLSYAVSGLSSGSYVFRVKATKNNYVDSTYKTSGACVVP